MSTVSIVAIIYQPRFYDAVTALNMPEGRLLLAELELYRMNILIGRGRNWSIVEARLLVNVLVKARGQRIDMKCFLLRILGRTS